MSAYKESTGTRSRDLRKEEADGASELSADKGARGSDKDLAGDFDDKISGWIFRIIPIIHGGVVGLGADSIGPRGQVLASCGGDPLAWRPDDYEGELAPRIARVTCAADVRASAIDTIQRCYVRRQGGG